MHSRFKPFWIVIAIMAIALVAAASISALRLGTGADFVAENSAAMDRMMQRMDAGRSADVDRNFAATMIPHHQGAIDMALTQLRHGHNEKLRRLAQGILVEQQQEIAAMQAVLDEELPPPDGPPDLGPVCRTRPPR
jgi:uncharacterized protein (DUF305 family)